jgi:hypothetical protein
VRRCFTTARYRSKAVNAQPQRPSVGRRFRASHQKSNHLSAQS